MKKLKTYSLDEVIKLYEERNRKKPQNKQKSKQVKKIATNAILNT